MENTISKPRLFVSFSGGRSSAYMAKKIKSEYSDVYQIIFGFANTGCENEETLMFVDRCDREWGLECVWLEAVVYHDERRGSGHKVVDFRTASRNGEPFKEVIKKYGIPNQAFPHCTRELKLNPMKSYLESIGWVKGTYKSAVGIRGDEPKRLRKNAEKVGIVYPLAHWFPISKPEINDWWAEQSFDLGLEDYRGNCKWCWKKSTTKLVRIAQETPEAFDFPILMEKEYPLAGCNPDPFFEGRTFFRHGMSGNGIMELANMGDKRYYPKEDPDENSGCSESCEAFLIPEEDEETYVS